MHPCHCAYPDKNLLIKIIYPPKTVMVTVTVYKPYTKLTTECTNYEKQQQERKEIYTGSCGRACDDTPEIILMIRNQKVIPDTVILTVNKDSHFTRLHSFLYLYISDNIVFFFLLAQDLDITLTL